MKKIFLVAVLLLLVSNRANAQASITNTTCPGIGCTDINVGGQGSIGIQITGTWVGTITFKSTIDNSTYTDLRVVSSADTTSAGATTTTSNGSFQTTVTGLAKVRVVFTSWMSGTALVSSRVTNQAAKFNGGGVSGGGVVTACGASDTEVLFVDGTSCAGDSALTWDKTTDSMTFGTTNNLSHLIVSGNYDMTGLVAGGNSNRIIYFIDNADTTGSITIGDFGPSNKTVEIDGRQLYLYGLTSGLDFDATASGFITADHPVSAPDFVLQNGTALKSDTTTAHTALFQAYDVNAAAYVTAATLTNANAPSFNIAPSGDLTVGITTTLLTTSGSGLTVANVGANSCGTTAATIAGNSNSFEITVGAGAGTQCRVAFPVAAPVRYNCVMTDSTTTIATKSTFVDTTHTDFLGAFVAGDVLTAICLPR